MSALHAALHMVRTVAHHSEKKGKRGFADYVSDRLVQACTEPKLLGAMERFCGLMDCELSGVYQPALVAFMQSSQTAEGPAVLAWLRQYPRVAAMLCMLKAEEYDAAVQALSLSGDEVPPADDRVRGVPEYDIPIGVSVLTPLSHGADGKAGNATLFRRQLVLGQSGGTMLLPFYAGNALRGQMRDLLADHFLRSIGLAPSRTQPAVKLWFFYALYSGGMLEEQAVVEKGVKQALGDSGAVKADGVHIFRDMLPGLSVLGCALGNRIIPGRIAVGDLRVDCVQWGTGDKDVNTLFDWQFLTRREDLEVHEDHTGMIATTEVLRPGSTLSGGVDVDGHASELERAALGRGLALLMESGQLGADGRRGYGKVRIAADNVPDPGPYDAYLAERSDSIRAYLADIGGV